MLLQFLEKAVQMGGEAIEIEYKDGKQWIFVYRGNVGGGIASLESGGADSKVLFRELADLKKKKRADLCGTTHRLAFSQYESFGEWVQRIEIKPARATAS